MSFFFFDDINDQKSNLLKTIIIDYIDFFCENVDDRSKHMHVTLI